MPRARNNKAKANSAAKEEAAAPKEELKTVQSESDWALEQQEQFEAALLKYPASLVPGTMTAR